MGILFKYHSFINLSDYVCIEKEEEMNFDNPSYLENDYLDSSTPIAGIHPEPISQFRESEINARKK